MDDEWAIDFSDSRRAHIARVLGLVPKSTRLRGELDSYLRGHERWTYPDDVSIRTVEADRGLLALMRHQGLHPIAMMTLNVTRDGVNVRHGVRQRDSTMIQAPREGYAHGHAYMAVGVSWIAEQHCSVRVRLERRLHDLPDTMLAGMKGRRLREVVSHPAVDHMGCVVKHVQHHLDYVSLWLDGVSRERISKV